MSNPAKVESGIRQPFLIQGKVEMNLSDSMESSIQYFQGCPEEHILISFDRGELNERLIDPIANHVASCRQCQIRLEEFKPDFFESSLRDAVQPDSKRKDRLSIREEMSKKESIIDEIIEKFRKEVPGLDTIESNKTNRFVLSKQIGSGAFGEVHLAYDHEKREAVALKITSEAVTNDWSQLETFRSDAAFMQSIEHKSFVPILDYGCWEGYRGFMTMPVIDGKTFNQWLSVKPRPIRTAMKLFHKILDALEYLHQMQKLHRNLKPSNIFVTREQEIVITDTGLFCDERYSNEMTAEDIDRFRYLPPEQFNLPHDKLGCSADIFPLGKILELILHQVTATGGGEMANYLLPLAGLSQRCTLPVASERLQSIDDLRRLLFQFGF